MHFMHHLIINFNLNPHYKMSMQLEESILQICRVDKTKEISTRLSSHLYAFDKSCISNTVFKDCSTYQTECCI